MDDLYQPMSLVDRPKVAGFRIGTSNLNLSIFGEFVNGI